MYRCVVCGSDIVCLFVCLQVTCVDISTELDMTVSGAKVREREREGEERERYNSSGAQDGTCIIHTVQRGHYMHTLLPRKERHKCVVRHALISPLGRLLVYTEDKLARSKVSHTPSYPHYVWYSGKYSWEGTIRWIRKYSLSAYVTSPTKEMCQVCTAVCRLY